MENLKIRVSKEAESKEAQELFFKLGFTWSGNSKDIFDFDMPEYIVNWNNGYLTVGDHSDGSRKEITLPELRAMVHPMKEYLVPDNGGYRVAVQDAGLPIAEDWIAIPEGAECLTKCKDHNGDEWFLFWKGDYKFCIGHDKEWFCFESGVSEYLNDCRGLAKFIWQRATQPEELPFVDDEPKYTDDEVKYMNENGQGRLQSLNDQYAEIEQMRQDEKQERNSSAWDVQIGGNHYKQFKIQPMQFALENKLDAAQHNVIKYIMRHSFKNGKQDLEKAKHYIDLMIEFYYGENNND